MQKSDIGRGQMHSDIIKGVGENIWVKHPYGWRKGGERSEPTAASRPSNGRAQRVILLVIISFIVLQMPEIDTDFKFEI